MEGYSVYIIAHLLTFIHEVVLPTVKVNVVVTNQAEPSSNQAEKSQYMGRKMVNS